MYNFINNATNINVIQECIHDTSAGYEADFRENGNVDGWDEFSGIHTYGSWGGFIFGTFIGSSGYIGRQSVFTPVPAETHYTVRLSMKISNVNTRSNPTTGRIMWRTINNSSWSSNKSYDFDIQADGVWHTYVLNVGTEQYWQGDVNDLRIYPMTDGGEDDEFFIKTIKIISTSTFKCNNPTCSYYSNYSHPCQGIGERAYCLAQAKEDNYFTIVKDSNDKLIVDINGYGDETITLSSGTNITGDVLAKDITRQLSKTDIGGYAEAQSTYSETGRFKIYSGTYTSDSSVSITEGTAREILGFDSNTTSAGSDPADGFEPKSSFKMKSYQLLGLFDGSNESNVRFDPFLYNVEGGRRDWLDNGIGNSNVHSNPDVVSTGVVVYEIIENENKTIIDFNHPFNASGKVKKLFIVGSVIDSDGNERTGCKVKIFRPRKNGELKLIHDVNIPARTSGKLYSNVQEYITLDCNLWVNKGDLLGVYNLDAYVGKSYDDDDADAMYYQVNGDASSEFDPGLLEGDGSSGLLFYGRSEERQDRLIVEVDLGKRVNIKDINITGESENAILEYNVARCLDINWQVELFGGTHKTGYYDTWNSMWKNYTHSNVAYGTSNLSDGIYTVNNGLAADSYTANDSNGVTPTNPHYFYINGDEEWVGELFHIGQYKADAYVSEFEEDPVALVLHFPYNKTKTVIKSAMYFKERHNFRNFAISYYLGPDALIGNADDYKYNLIPEYDSITIDGLEYDETNYDFVKEYIFENPCNAKPEMEGSPTEGQSNEIVNYDEYMAAQSLSWTVIKHEWQPVQCKGLRIYTNYHNSTKMNELEVFSYVANEGTSVADSTFVKHSQYEDLWTYASVEAETDESASAYIGGTPQYFIIEIEPITTIKISDIMFDVHSQDVYVGNKGCKYNVLLDHAKIGSTNEPSVIEFKNVYGDDYDLYVDIPSPSSYKEGATFWSKLNNDESITTPQVGPGAYFEQEDDYPLVFREKNCAINCPVYGLKNLVDGKSSYFSIEGSYWTDEGTLSSGVSIDRCNFSTLRKTVINLPILYRDRYWKIGFTCPDQTMNVYEARVYDGDTLLDYVGYHDPGVGFFGKASNQVPYLNDTSVTGTTYTIENDSYITFDTGSQKSVSKIVLFNENTSGDYSNSGCGIDRYTQLCLHCENISGLTTFVDSSYFTKTITAQGNAIIDNNSYFGSGAAKFDGLPSTYLEAAPDDAWDFYRYRWSVDFRVKFNNPPQEHTDWCYTVSGTGNGTGDILDVTDHDKSTYFESNSGSVIIDWGSVQPIDTVFMKWRPLSNYSHNFYGKLPSGSWESLGAGGGSGAASPRESWMLDSRKYYSAIKIQITGTSWYLYDLRATTIDDDKDVVLASNWNGKHPTMDWDENDGTSSDSWIFLWRDYGNFPALEFYVRGYRIGRWECAGNSSARSPGTSWFHLALGYGVRGYDNNKWAAFINGSRVSDLTGGTSFNYIKDTNNPIKFGKSLDGWMDEIRVSVGDEYLPGTNEGKGGARYHWDGFTPCTELYKRFYGVSVYTSVDNIIYGHCCDLDIKYEVDDPAIYYYPENVWSSTFYSYFAVDLGKRYALQIVRNYNGANLIDYSTTSDTEYSSTNTAVVDSAIFDGTHEDARWVIFKILNGDSTDRCIRELGIYSSLTDYIAPAGGYNHEWDSLGTSITSYSVGENLALNATVSGSSTFGTMYPGKITDGVVGDSLSECWGSDDSSTQWLMIDLGGVYPIYRIKIHHGYDDSDTDYMVEDYNIGVSTSGTPYTNIFTINNNSSFEREHVLDEPVDARYIKMNITDYSSSSVFRPTGDGYDWFNGAVIREIEVNKYYGFEIIDSEEYPVIAINLNDQFPIESHSLVGIDPEDTSTDWDNSEGNFAYSDSVLTEPKKISFGGWRSGVSARDQWVVIKRDTATDYNSGPDYLKHAKIASYEYPNPCDYSWWWKSSLSTLSNDYLNVIEALRSLKIEYPTSSGVEHVYMIEGDTFGTDEVANWRDALSIWWYIDDKANLDDSYGYFYFGDVNSADYVEYRWDIEFLYDSIQSGWNKLFLRFKSATDILYVESNDPNDQDTRIISNLENKSFGIRFKGKGNPLTMNIDSLKIERNRFMDYSRFSQGLYIARDDYLSFPIAEFDMSKGTIEFWLRPDYNYMGVDMFNVLRHRTLFHFTNVANDVFGALISFNGLVVYHGNIGEEVNTLNFEVPYWEIDDLFHLAFVFSNTGSIDIDGSAVRVYMNNILLGSHTQTWDIEDSKKFKFIVGGKSIHAVKDSFPASSVDGVMSNLRLYNYCKTNFEDSLSNYEIDRESLMDPNDLIQVSKDNVTYYSRGDINLPLLYSNVPNGNSVSLYTRSVIPDNITGDEARTAYISASWFITV